ncbi:tetratricopeptide repeat protein [Gymnodinialimonas sp.]
MRLFPFTLALLLPCSAAFGDELATAQAECFDDTLPAETMIGACAAAMLYATEDTDIAEAANQRGALRQVQGNLEGAIQDYEVAAELAPQDMVPHYNLFLVHDELDNTDAALASAQAAIMAQPDRPLSYSPMMALSVRNNDAEQCAPIMTAVLDLVPDPAGWGEAAEGDYWFMTNLGDCLYFHERDELAMAAYETAVALGHDDAYVYLSMALTHFYLGQMDEVESDARAALDRDPTYLYPLDPLVNAYLAEGRYEDVTAVLAEFAPALDASDNDVEVRNNMAWRMFVNGEVDMAIPIMEAWLAWAEPRMDDQPYPFGNSFDTIAHLRAATGDTEGAAEAFRLAFEHYESPEAARANYRPTLAALGYEVGEGDAAILEALDACAATGPACRLIPEG